MNKKSIVYISKNTEFSTAKNNEVIVKNDEKVFSLNGKAVGKYLIPMLVDLEKGVNIDDISKYGDCDYILKNIISPLINMNLLSVGKSSEEQKSSPYYLIAKEKKIGLVAGSRNYVFIKHIFDKFFGEVKMVAELSEDEYLFDSRYLRRLEDNMSKYDYIVIVETESNEKFESLLNKMLCESDTKGIFCKIQNYNVNIGPTIIPGKVGCLECLKFRKINNNENADKLSPFFKGNVYGNSNPSCINSETNYLELSVGLNLLLLELLRVIIMDLTIDDAVVTRNMPLTLEGVESFDILSGELTTNKFLKNPNCPVCNSKIYSWPEVNPWMDDYTYKY